MSSLTLATVVYASLLSTGLEKVDSYAQARQAAQDTGKPIVVMVSATWCGPCQQMKKTVLPECKRRGLLKRVSFAVVDVDRQRKLAKKLTGGGPIPQLVMYRRSIKGWKRQKLVGGQSVESIEKFVKEGVAKNEAAQNEAAQKAADDTEPNEQTAQHTSGKAKVRPVSNR